LYILTVMIRQVSLRQHLAQERTTNLCESNVLGNLAHDPLVLRKDGGVLEHHCQAANAAVIQRLEVPSDLQVTKQPVRICCGVGLACAPVDWPKAHNQAWHIKLWFIRCDGIVIKTLTLRLMFSVQSTAAALSSKQMCAYPRTTQ
jgi:hypothetical protein